MSETAQLISPDSLEEITLGDIGELNQPARVYQYLGHYGALDDRSLGSAFQQLLVARHADGERTVLGLPVYFPCVCDEYGGVESQVAAVDLTGDGDIAGQGRIRYMSFFDSTDPLHERPTVGYNGTEPDYLRGGFGSRRLMVMNAASQLLYGAVLHSALNFSNNARNLWLYMVREGHAERYEEAGQERFRFLEPERTTV